MTTRVKGLGARSGLLAQAGEFQRMAQEMAAASIGLRGWEAKAAQSQARRKYEARRWAWIIKRASASLERIILRDHAEFERRVAAVLASSKFK